MSGENQENIFYKNARLYWANVPATLEGVLGGFGHINDIDLDGSRAFINEVLLNEDPPGCKRALDCGAGIGRITKNILLPLCEKVDLVEQDAKFVAAALKEIGPNNPKLGEIYQIGLQHFIPKRRYDITWCQWVLGHLNDDDMCAFLKRCRDVLNENGVIFIKENVTADDELEYDEVDSSVTRPYELFMKIFEVAGLKVINVKAQEDFPDDIYSVYMFALTKRPKTNWGDMDD